MPDARRTRRNGYLFATVAVVLLVVVAVLVQRAGTPARAPLPSSPDSPAREATTNDPAPAPGSASTRVAARLHPLPSAGRTFAADAGAAALPRFTPLASVFDELARRADHGDPEAACRLAWDLDLCDAATGFADSRQFWIDVAAQTDAGSGDEGASVYFLETMDRWEQRSAPVCDGLLPEQRAQASQRMAQAARLGHPLSMAYFAAGQGFPENLTLADADSLVYFRDNALALLRASAAMGETTALLLLSSACTRGNIVTMHGDIAFPADPECALAASLALRSVSLGTTADELATTIPDLRAQLDAPAVARAERLADRYAAAARLRGRPARDFQEGIFGPDVGETCVPPADLRSTPG